MNVSFGYDIRAVHIAAGRNDLQLALKLAEQGDLDCNCRNVHGFTPLIIACMMHSKRFIKFLVSNGADVNLTDYHKKSPLHYACLLDSLELAKTLVYRGADVNLVNSFGRSPLAIALLESKSNTMAKFLLNHGAHPDYENFQSFRLFLGELR